MTMDMVGSQILVAKLQVKSPGTRKYPLKEKKKFNLESYTP